MKKILIFYASYGGGHLNAAKSVHEYLINNYPSIDVEFIDCMKYINKAVEKISTVAYRETAKLAPWMWGKIYDDSQKGPLSHFTSRTNKVMAIKLLQLLREKQPDLIVSTHPFSSQMCSYLKRKNKINTKIATIMTDYAPHDQWLLENDHTDFFFVAHSKMKQDLIEKNISPNTIFDLGIPLSNRFLRDFDRQYIFNAIGLDQNKKTVLFFGGGEFGLGKTKTCEYFEDLVKNSPEIQIIAISGKNEKMKEMFESIVIEHNATNRVKVLSFTDKIPELMSISDLVITKPGGMTTTESLASNLPMIIINPIPGQEEENAEFLENENVAIWIKKDMSISLIINDLFENQHNIESMKQNILEISKKDSTANICKTMLSTNI